MQSKSGGRRAARPPIGGRRAARPPIGGSRAAQRLRGTWYFGGRRPHLLSLPFVTIPACRLAMPKFTSHIFICCNRREPGNSRGCCDPDGGEALRNCFKNELKKRGLGPLVRANKAGCLDQCELGPT